MKDEPFSTRLQHELDHLRSVFNEMGAYLFTKDLDGRYTYANQAVLDVTVHRDGVDSTNSSGNG
ncbi:hypothetical protein [Aeromonas allosaccharophila]